MVALGSVGGIGQFFRCLECSYQTLDMLGVLRFAHVQWSRIVQLERLCIIGKAALGKTFQRGRRAPFWWSAVRRGITGVDIGRKLCALLLSAVGEQDSPEFLLFDFAPKHASINSVSAIAAHKMGITRYTRFSTQLLQGPPAACTLEEATEFSDT